ncbi:hypothetical protein vseg_009244 [Gypsophila vaccaria]
MEKHRCKLCSKTFANWRALGGHMRSHTVHQWEPSPSPSPSPSSSLGFEAEEEGEMSESESGKTVTRRRSKRTRKPSSSLVQFHVEQCKLVSDDFGGVFSYDGDDNDQQFGSSISDVSSEEDVAFCLMMLSRDQSQWTGHEDVHHNKYSKVDLSYENSCDEKIVLTKSHRKKYKCETCNKVFRSYQALGGHRASHKRARVTIVDLDHEHDEDNVVAVVKEEDKKIHECPICFRVFGSGQALGGHKRSHVIKNGGTIENPIEFQVIDESSRMKKMVVDNLIDLNLPAIDDDDGEEEEEEEAAVSDVHS